VEPLKEKVQVVLQAAHRAGIEVARDGRVSQETEAQIQKPLLPADELAKMANRIWDSLLQGITPSQKTPKGQKKEEN
jgi:hypothetical protein